MSRFGSRRGGNNNPYDHDTAEMVRVQNDELLNQLDSRVDILRQLSDGLAVDIKKDEVLLKDVGSGLDKTMAFFSNTMGKMGIMMESGSNKKMFTIACGIFLVFVFFFFIMPSTSSIAVEADETLSTNLSLGDVNG